MRIESLPPECGCVCGMAGFKRIYPAACRCECHQTETREERSRHDAIVSLWGE